MKKLFTLLSLASALAVNAAVTVTPTTMPNGNTGCTYSVTCRGTGGTAPYRFTKTAGTLPAGTALGLQNGVLTGVLTATVSTTYTFTIRATDAVAATGSRTYTVVVAPASLTTNQIVNLWSSRNVPDLCGINATWYSVWNTATGGTPLIRGTNTYTAATTITNNAAFSLTPTTLTIAPSSTYSLNATGNLTERSGSVWSNVITASTGANVLTTGTYTVTNGDNYFNTVGGSDKYYKSIAAATGTLTEDIGTNKYNFFVNGSTGNTSLQTAGTYSLYSGLLTTIGSPSVSISGLVGIGTASPIYNLDVIGGNDAVRFRNTGNFNPALRVEKTDGNPAFQVIGNGQAQFYSDLRMVNCIINGDVTAPKNQGMLSAINTTSSATSWISTFYSNDTSLVLGMAEVSKSVIIGGDGTLYPTAKLEIRGDDSTDASYSLMVKSSSVIDSVLFNVRNDGSIETKKVINSTAGDDATINASSGRFRKDASGTTFALTNSLITSESTIILTPAGNLPEAGYLYSVVAGAGSAVITFWSVLLNVSVADAPTANFDLNFLVIN